MMKDIVARIEGARAAGIDVSADVYPYIASANRLSASLPDWVHEGGTDAMMARLRDPALRPRMARGVREDGFAPADILTHSAATPTDSAAGGTDGSFANEAAPPRAFATTARTLGRYARELKLFPIEEAVRRMTSLPARRIGLWDRGLVRLSFAADLVAFDPERVSDTATFEDPKRYPEGIEIVVVNGKVVLEGGKRTRERPGAALLHRGRP